MAENYNQAIQNSVQGRFWGWDYSYGQPPASGPCMVGVYRSYYVLGIRVSTIEPVMEPIPGDPDRTRQVQVPCGTKYTP